MCCWIPNIHEAIQHGLVAICTQTRNPCTSTSTHWKFRKRREKKKKQSTQLTNFHSIDAFEYNFNLSIRSIINFVVKQYYYYRSLLLVFIEPSCSYKLWCVPDCGCWQCRALARLRRVCVRLHGWNWMASSRVMVKIELKVGHRSRSGDTEAKHLPIHPRASPHYCWLF